MCQLLASGGLSAGRARRNARDICRKTFTPFICARTSASAPSCDAYSLTANESAHSKEAQG